MKIIKPHHEILTPLDGEQVLKHIEACGRVCYKSEHKTTDSSYLTFVRNIVKRGHEAVLEHFALSVKYVCDGVFPMKSLGTVWHLTAKNQLGTAITPKTIFRTK